MTQTNRRSAEEMGETAMKGAELALCCGKLADEKQGEDITVLDLRGLSQITDYFVICSGSSLPHLRAVRDEICEGLAREENVRPLHRDGAAESQWMVLDYVDVMVHIFHREKRKFYDLEQLWSDAPQLDWKTGEVMVREE